MSMGSWCLTSFCKTDFLIPLPVFFSFSSSSFMEYIFAGISFFPYLFLPTLILPFLLHLKLHLWICIYDRSTQKISPEFKTFAIWPCIDWVRCPSFLMGSNPSTWTFPLFTFIICSPPFLACLILFPPSLWSSTHNHSNATLLWFKVNYNKNCKTFNKNMKNKHLSCF